MFVEFDQVLRGLEHVHGLVHHNETTRPDTGPGSDQSFVVHAYVFPNYLISPHDVDRGATGNDGFQFLPTEHAAAVFHDELLHVVVAHGEFKNTWTVDMAGDGPEFCATAFFGTEFLICLAAHLDDVGDSSESLNIVHDSWTSIETRDGRKGRFHPRMTTESLKRTKQCRFLAANVSAGASMRVDLAGERTHNTFFHH